MTKEAKKAAVEKYEPMNLPKQEVIKVMINDGWENKEAEEIFAAFKGISQQPPPIPPASTEDTQEKQPTQPAQSDAQTPATPIVQEIHNHIYPANPALPVTETPKQKGTKGMTPEQIKEAQDKHPRMKWYDEFEVTIKKQEIYNLIADKREPVTTGFTLGVKKHPKFLEPALAGNFNAFMDGITFDGKGLCLLPKEKYTNGDFLKYEDWAVMVGRNLSRDRNYQLLKTYPPDAN